MRAGSTLLRRLGALRVGELVMLRQAVGQHARGSLVRIEQVIEAAGGMAYIVQPLREDRDEHGQRALVSDGACLTLEGREVARSLPDMRTGPQTFSGTVVQDILDLIENRLR